MTLLEGILAIASLSIFLFHCYEILANQDKKYALTLRHITSEAKENQNKYNAKIDPSPTDFKIAKSRYQKLTQAFNKANTNFGIYFLLFCFFASVEIMALLYLLYNPIGNRFMYFSYLLSSWIRTLIVLVRVIKKLRTPPESRSYPGIIIRSLVYLPYLYFLYLTLHITNMIPF